MGRGAPFAWCGFWNLRAPHLHLSSDALPSTRPHLLTAPLPMGLAFKFMSLWESNHQRSSQCSWIGSLGLLRDQCQPRDLQMQAVLPRGEWFHLETEKVIVKSTGKTKTFQILKKERAGTLRILILKQQSYSKQDDCGFP